MEAFPAFEPFVNCYHAAVADSIADTMASIIAARDIRDIRDIRGQPARDSPPLPRPRPATPQRIAAQTQTTAAAPPRTVIPCKPGPSSGAKLADPHDTSASATTAALPRTAIPRKPVPSASTKPAAEATTSALPRTIIPRKPVASAESFSARTGLVVPAGTRPGASIKTGPTTSDGKFSARTGLVVPSSTANFTRNDHPVPTDADIVIKDNNFIPLMTSALPITSATAEASAPPRASPAAASSAPPGTNIRRETSLPRELSNGRISKGKGVAKHKPALPLIPEGEPVSHTVANSTERMERYIKIRKPTTQGGSSTNQDYRRSSGIGKFKACRGAGLPLFESISVAAGLQADTVTADVEAQVQRYEDGRRQRQIERSNMRRNLIQHIFKKIFEPCLGERLVTKA
ncbi:hypothetical protein F4821DRAFT_162425 [Hypoxylon rubiginosum]|uniref:Uncharacterized protein n=1 Tax=Hypoxylon rubiginosum TaxID=110542 RepID=A0ACC0CX03_9PEZI|nr:hypothetical protein F4821DRAFT_162425 [Hypoxylon rubiginosum]